LPSKSGDIAIDGAGMRQKPPRAAFSVYDYPNLRNNDILGHAGQKKQGLPEGRPCFSY